MKFKIRHYSPVVHCKMSTLKSCLMLQTSSKAPSPEHMANTQKMVHDLQEELAVIKVREAEAQCTIHELHARIREIENVSSV